jgi:hypothetical protein
LPPSPSSRADLSAVDQVAEDARRAAAALAVSRELRRSTEPPVKWSNADNRFRSLVASYDDKAAAEVL